MIPVTLPQGAPQHVRKTPDENLIFSLQTQLALQTELCQQYENDLRSRDELVEILGKKIADFEKEDLKRRSVIRTWRKKVQELERICRYLEDEVEGSSQNSMVQSIMYEASGEVLRMLHRQISVQEEKLRQRDKEEKEHLQQIKQREAEAEKLREETSDLRRKNTRTVDELKRALEEASLQEVRARAQVEDLVRRQATFNIESKPSTDKMNALKEEVERQRRRIQVLQQESADKEVKLLQLNKQHKRDKEDLEGMNTALDSKQMELELLKRKLGIRGD